jgi:hypothetical protein
MNGIGDAFEGWDDTKEIAKNIIMIGVIRGMGLIPGQKITPAFMKNPAKMNQFALETLKVA